LLPIRGRRVWEEFPGSAPFDASASTPRGASGLGGGPTPDDPRSCSITFPTHPLTRKSERQWGHRQGQEVSRAERAEREERPARLTSCPQDTRPTPLAWSQALSSQSCAAADRPSFEGPPRAADVPEWSGTSPAGLLMINNGERTCRLLIRNPFPLESPGALGILPLLSVS
jgi:hypothetical protein